MKPLFLTLFLIASSALTYKASAVNSTHPPVTAGSVTISPQMSVDDFLAIDFKNYRTADGQKLKWGKRFALGMAQNSLAKKIKKGNVEGTTTLDTALAQGSNNIHGLLSVIFGAVGLFVPILGLGLLIAGLVLGIIGIKKDASPTLAIIGTALCGAFLLFIVIALIVIASGCWLYC